jgi:hypothetical protein
MTALGVYIPQPKLLLKADRLYLTIFGGHCPACLCQRPSWLRYPSNHGLLHGKQETLNLTAKVFTEMLKDRGNRGKGASSLTPVVLPLVHF